MSAWPPPAAMEALRGEARAVAARLALVMHTPRGRAGSLAGRGAGASVEIEDHRPFVPGDDPRHMDWNAFGRTGQWVAKTFRAEVSAAVDIAFDASRSMAVFEGKRDRALQVFYVVFEGARRVGASVRAFSIVGDAVTRMPTEAIDAGLWLPDAPVGSPLHPALGRVPWRAEALRVLVSDLLYPERPEAVLRPLAQGAGRAVVLAPRAAQERRPDWQDNLTLVDVETDEGRAERIDEAAYARYLAAYEAHFGGYAEAATRLGAVLATIDAEGTLAESLVKDSLPRGVFAPWT